MRSIDSFNLEKQGKAYFTVIRNFAGIKRRLVFHFDTGASVCERRANKTAEQSSRGISNAQAAPVAVSARRNRTNTTISIKG